MTKAELIKLLEPFDDDWEILLEDISHAVWYNMVNVQSFSQFKKIVLVPSVSSFFYNSK